MGSGTGRPTARAPGVLGVRERPTSLGAVGRSGRRLPVPRMGDPKQTRMLINGATVDDSLVPELARAIGNPRLAHKLQTAHRFRTGVINLNNAERTLVLAALDDSSSTGLQALRAQLLEHQAWRPTKRVT